MLCFFAAFGGVAGGVWSFVANALISSSIADVSERLPEDAKSAMGQLSTLNLVAAVGNLLIAVGFIAGGVALLRRKPAGRKIVAAACIVEVLAVIALYAFDNLIWTRVVTATQDVKSLEANNFGPGLGSVIWKCTVAALIVVLAFWSSIRQRPDAGARPAGAPSPGRQGVATKSVAPLPPTSGGTAIAAAMVSIVGSLLFSVGLAAGTVSLVDPSNSQDALLLAAVAAVLSSPIGIGLIVGGLLLLRRRNAGRFVIVACWPFEVLVYLGALIVVVTSPSRPSGALVIVSAALVVVVVCAVVASTLALVAPTRRWCLARNARRPGAPPSTTAA